MFLGCEKEIQTLHRKLGLDLSPGELLICHPESAFNLRAEVELGEGEYVAQMSIGESDSTRCMEARRLTDSSSSNLSP